MCIEMGKPNPPKPQRGDMFIAIHAFPFLSFAHSLASSPIPQSLVAFLCILRVSAVRSGFPAPSPPRSPVLPFHASLTRFNQS